MANQKVSSVRIICLVCICTTGSGLIVADRVRSAEDSQKNLQLVTTENMAAIDRIRAFSANYLCEQTQPRKEIISRGSYMRTSDTVRIRVGIEGEWMSDFRVKDGETRVLNRFWDSHKILSYQAERASSAKMIGISDIWMGMLLSIVGPRGQPMPIDRLLQSAKRPPQSSRETLDGHPCIRVNLQFDDPAGRELNVTIWLDVNCNYLVRKRMMTGTGDWSTVATITRFAEISPGVFFPVECTAQNQSGSKILNQWSYSLSDVMLNGELPEKALEMPSVPSGTMMSDRTNETKYPIDSSWKQIGKAEADRIMTASDTAKGSSRFTSPSKSEPLSPERWIIYISLALLATVCATVAIRWIRKRNRTEAWKS